MSKIEKVSKLLQIDQQENLNKNKLDTNILLEKNLTFGDLDKTTQGQKKGDILLAKIIRGEDIPLKSDDGDDVKIKKISDIINQNTGQITSKDSVEAEYTPYETSKMKDVFLKRPDYRRYTKSLRSEDGTEYKLNDIVKTSDFGSSGGSSLGTEGTIKIESIYCFYFAVRQFLGRDISYIDDISKYLQVSDILSHIKIPSHVKITEELLDKFYDWENSFIETVNIINRTEKYLLKDKKNKTILSSDKRYSFHQINSRDELISSLSNKYYSLMKGIPISKWTPSDIWAVDVDRKNIIVELIKSCETLSDLNRVINTSFDRCELIGISIKKIKNEEDALIVINNETPKPNYNFSGGIILDKPLGTLNTTIIVNRKSEVYGDGEEKIDFRTFDSGISNIQGEIIGKETKSGKISLKQINKMLKDINIRQVPTYSELIDKNESDIRNEIIDMNNNILDNILLEDLVRKSILRSSPKPETKRRLISKYQSLFLSKILLEAYPENSKDIDNFIEKIFYYALAIENEHYECPKYVRIV